ncbi:MAG: hypothetical protein IPH13_15430 [Planctomycetes bacterium]|nr:hypothetical protein [Planctomycetota bacterium]
MSVSRTARLFVSTVWLGFAPTSLMLAQTPLFEITDLGTFTGGVVPFPSAVNDHGLVVGNAFAPAGGYIPVYMSAAQSPAALQLLAGDINGFAFGVSNAGVIVGASTNGSGVDRGVVWTPSPSGYVVTPLPMTSAGQSPTIARALNELGDVVGELSNGNGFAWSAATGTIDLGTLGFTGTARGINESRQVVGGHNRIDLDTQVIDVGTLSNVTSWNFTAIADSGIAVYASSTTGPIIGTIQAGGTYEFGVGPTGYAAGLPGFVAGIDYAGDVAYSTAIGVPSGSVLHTATLGPVPLPSRIDPPAPQLQLDPWSTTISANGTIALNAFDQGSSQYLALLLTPKTFRGIIEGPLAATSAPVLVGEGTLLGGSPTTFKLSKAPASTPLALIAGLSRADLPFYGSLLVPTPTLVLTGLTTDATGKLVLSLTWPVGLPAGLKMYLQVWVVDAGAPFGVSGTNALECEMP